MALNKKLALMARNLLESGTISTSTAKEIVPRLWATVGWNN
jgi:hypothetical protein